MTDRLTATSRHHTGCPGLGDATIIARSAAVFRYVPVEMAMNPMNKKTTAIAMALSAALLAAGAARADVTLNSVRLGAVNTVALAKFYQSAFGMQEVNRLETQAGPEIFLNFGATADAGKANQNLSLVLMHRDSDAAKDPIARVIFNVTDMAATVAAIKAAGGSMDGEPRPFRDSGLVIGIAVDPAGNRLELIQRR
jgi:predicted enzyme related to lactoylglutathione lyase